MRKKSFNIISSKIVLSTPRMEMEERNVECPDGTIRTVWVRKKMDFAIIIPKLNEDTFVLINQYRYGIEKYSIEFPQGSAPSMSMEEVAALELEQECGYKAEKLTKIGRLQLSPGYSYATGFIFCAENLKETAHAPEDGEFIEVLKVSTEELESWIAEGKIIDAATVASYHLYKQHHNNL